MYFVKIVIQVKTLCRSENPINQSWMKTIYRCGKMTTLGIKLEETVFHKIIEKTP